MSWCGGGEIRPTPAMEWRTRAMVSSILWPGNWPPSPGLAPCAILIWISSALIRKLVLQIVDELRQILDGVDVVVRRRRDRAHAGDGAARPRDGISDLVAGQLAALAGLGTLRHLDLDLVGEGGQLP